MENQLYQEFCTVLKKTGQVKRDELMKNHTTFRVGGAAKLFVTPYTKSELVNVLRICQKAGCPWFLLGNGSNLLVSDKGFDGTVIKLEGNFTQVEVLEGGRIYAGGGALLAQAAKAAAESGLTGFEFAAGIPGTLGGALVMNAGAYGQEIKDVLVSAAVLTPSFSEAEVSAKDLKLGYRTSALMNQDMVVLSAVFQLKEGRMEDIQAKIRELAAARKEKQPLEYPSAGSTFKRPEGYFAGKLIQDAGLRGVQIGGAQVSEKHCGFVINRGDASASEIMQLCRQVKRKVKEIFNVDLEMEVKTLGEFTEK